MTCEAAQERLPDLFDADMRTEVSRELIAHVVQCRECAAEWEELAAVFSAIRPVPHVRASYGFKERVLALAMEPRPQRRFWRMPLLRALLASSAVLALAVIASIPGPPNRNCAAEPAGVLDDSIRAVSKMRSWHISARMLSAPGLGDVTPVQIWKQSGIAPKWRMDTPSWTQWVEPGSSVEYYKQANMAIWRAQGTPLFWAGELVAPDKMLLAERDAMSDAQSKCTVVKRVGGRKGEVVLSVRRRARGSIPADLLRLEDAADADQTRVYRFDARNMRLIGVQVTLHTSHGDLVLYETTEIRYDEPINQEIFALHLPADIVWT
jgi:hypothetical protein